MFRATRGISRSALSGRRFASTSPTQAAEGAKDAASSAAAKAQQALGGASEKGAELYKKASALVGNALGSYKEPIVHNYQVTREVLKQVYVAEKLSPPSLAQVSSSYSTFFHNAPNFSFWQKLYQSGEWKQYGIYAIEAYGIFKIGEMIGRRHVIGYKLDESRAKAGHGGAH